MLILIIFIFLLILFISKNKSSFMKRNDIYTIAFNKGVEWLNFVNNENKKLKIPNIQQAVMFDIDDTLLNVNKNFKQIDPIINLLKYSKKLGFLVIIITAREKTETNLNFTIQQLYNNGIFYHRLYLRPVGENPYTFKTNLKKMILQEYNIPFILSVGDQWFDVDPDYSGYSLKLPNETDKRLYYLNLNNKQWEYLN
jgi:hypothetical protein